MKILGIETSCDETAAAVVDNGKIISSVIASSLDIHTKTGGIIPEQAAREQIKSIIPVISEALIEARHPGTSITSDRISRDSDSIIPIKSGLQNDNFIDAIAVTYGPGLIGSLLVGVEIAKTLSYLWNKPLIPVNHLVAHLYANWTNGGHPGGDQPIGSSPQEDAIVPIKSGLQHDNTHLPQFPAIGLVVSGGHTDMVMLKGHNDIKWIGGTRDDAAGEAFDKTARLLGLPYPGGPSISSAAEDSIASLQNDHNLNLFPRPMINEDNLDFSFSGLKTAVLNYVNSHPGGDQPIGSLAAQIQEAIVDVIVSKSLRAIKAYKPKSFLLSGGVAANKRLREKLIEKLKDEEVTLYIPEARLCTDNAVSTAIAAFYHDKQIPWQEVTANPNLTIEDL